MRTALAAKIVCLGGDDDAARGSFAEMKALSAPTAGPERWREWAAGLIHGLYTADDLRIQEVRSQWNVSRIWSPNRQFVDRLFVFIGYPPTYQPMDIAGDGHDEIDKRWHAVINTLVRTARR